MKIRDMKKMTKVVLALGTLLGLGGCDMEVPDLNRLSLEAFEKNPTRPQALSAATGLLIGHRTGMATQNGYVSMLGVLGRESYVMDTADPRYVGEMLAGLTLDPGSPAFGGNFWTNPYANIRNANTLLNALDKVPGMSQGEKDATRGFAKTIQALDFLVIVNTRDTNGAPVDVNREIGSEPAPIVGKEAVLAHIAGLLDEAKVDLEKSGAAGFPFSLSSGFTDFDAAEGEDTPMTVSNFIKVNRALKARVDVYRKDWNQALTDLSQSFIDPTGPLNKGVYHAFGTGSGDTQNELNDKDIFVHPSVLTGAEMQWNDPATTENESLKQDDRVLRKVKAAKEPRKWQGVSSSHVFKHYPGAEAPLPIIRNEELLLLRAEANLQLGNIDLAAEDLNTIRVRSGKLAPRLDLNETNIVGELLQQRRYSLLFEGGHRWIDVRRYERTELLPLDVEGHRVHLRFPIPLAEMDGRPKP